VDRDVGFELSEFLSRILIQIFLRADILKEARKPIAKMKPRTRYFMPKKSNL